MHSMIVFVWYLIVNGLKREWWLDLPALTSIRLGNGALHFFENSSSSKLIMRSSDDEMNWWIDLPKLTTLTTVEDSITFCFPRTITLEGFSYHSILTSRHALSHYCHSTQGMGFLRGGDRSHQEFLFLLSLIPRHHSRSPTVFPVPCFFHTPLSSQHQIAVFTSHNNYSFPYSLSLSLLHSISWHQEFLHTRSLISQ